jgi:C1A family cysteine protease
MEPVSDKTMESMNLSWVNQNHSVLIVGWGYNADADMKYWIIRNSYSAKWGMKGDFLMKRGSNDFGIEADIVAFDPVEA